jgi:hypothetical protein
MRRLWLRPRLYGLVNRSRFLLPRLMIAARSAPQRGVGRVVAAVQAFAGFALLGAALVALAATFEPGRAAAWARIGLAGTVAGVAVAAALQAVDGIALKVTVDRAGRRPLGTFARSSTRRRSRCARLRSVWRPS